MDATVAKGFWFEIFFDLASIAPFAVTGLEADCPIQFSAIFGNPGNFGNCALVDSDCT